MSLKLRLSGFFLGVELFRAKSSQLNLFSDVAVDRECERVFWEVVRPGRDDLDIEQPAVTFNVNPLPGTRFSLSALRGFFHPLNDNIILFFCY